MNLVVFTDGASRSNPGHAAIGYRITDGRQELESGGEYIGVKTNNEAEYLALIKAVKESMKYNPVEITFYSDSQLMIKQLRGEWKIKKQELRKLFDKVKLLLKDLKVNFIHVKRDNPGIQKCDALANQALDKHLGY